MVERAFATLYGRIRATLNLAKLTEILRGWLWEECALVAIKVQNLLVDKYGDKCAHEKFCGELPKYGKHLKEFG